MNFFALTWSWFLAATIIGILGFLRFYFPFVNELSIALDRERIINTTHPQSSVGFLQRALSAGLVPVALLTLFTVVCFFLSVLGAIANIAGK